MRTIRSLLWIGSGAGLSQSGFTEAPELDVTWVPELEEALLLPGVRFDGILLEAAGTADLEETVDRLERLAPRDGLLVATTDERGETAERWMAAGIGALFVHDPRAVGRGFVDAVHDALDAAAEKHRDPSQTGSGRHEDTPRRRVASSTAPRASATAAPSTETAATPEPTATESATRPSEPARFVGESDAMRDVSELVDLAASSPSTVLITGETGAGKEVIARELHARGARGDEPFVAINCAAFPETLLESELFGFAKGAFTGADRDKQGLFEAAGRGTLFLDEIAETELALQAKLLRVLQEREILPVGDVRPRPIACRIIAATNRVLADEVEQSRFREDLFYRLNVFPIRIPPLRERRADILPLARRFLAMHGPREGKHDCHFSLATGHLLESYAWPGNVRELENEVLRALMLTPSGQLITPRQLSPKLVEILEPIAHGAHPEESLREALDRIESWLIRRALANNEGRKARTARRLGLTREGLYKKMKRLGIG